MLDNIPGGWGPEAQRAKNARLAIDVQDAVNPRPILKLAHDISLHIGREPISADLRDADDCPELVILLSKLCSLLSVDGPSISQFSQAYDKCEAIAKGAQ